MASSTSSGQARESGLQVQNVERVFQHDQLNLPDPNPDLSPDQVREYYATQYPALANARVSSEGISGGEQVFTFDKSIGTKG